MSLFHPQILSYACIQFYLNEFLCQRSEKTVPFWMGCNTFASGQAITSATGFRMSYLFDFCYRLTATSTYCIDLDCRFLLTTVHHATSRRKNQKYPSYASALYFLWTRPSSVLTDCKNTLYCHRNPSTHVL